MTENIIEEERKIRVNVPGVSARFFLKLSGFVVADKAQFNKMCKAVSEDVETAEENRSAILATLEESRHAWQYGRGAFDRVKVLNSYFTEKETAPQKRFNKAVQAFCVGKKDPRQCLRLPFIRPDGKLYAACPFFAVRIDDPGMYTGEIGTDNATNMERLFPADYETWDRYTLPAEKVLKDWEKTGKTYKNDPLFTTSVLWKNGLCFNLVHLLRAVTVTGSNDVYVSEKLAVIRGEGITCIICSRQQNNETIRAFDKACMFIALHGQDVFSDISDMQPAQEETPAEVAQEVKQEETPAVKAEEEPEENKNVDDIQAENVTTAKTGNNDPVSISEFSYAVSNAYKYLYENGDRLLTREQWREYQIRFDEGLTDYEKRVLSAYVAYRKDCVSSDRSVAAFMYILDFFRKVHREIMIPEEPAGNEPPAEPAQPEEVPADDLSENLSAVTEEEPAPIEEPAPDEPFTIVYNSQFGSTDVSFREKPPAEVIQALKGLRFRWHKMKRVWYGYKDPETVRAAVLSADKPQEKEPAEKPSAISEKYKSYYETLFNALKDCHENPADPGKSAYYNGLLSAGSMFLPPETMAQFPRFS